MATEARTTELKARNHAAMLDGANVITTVIATHDKGSNATDADFAHYMTHDEKKPECHAQWDTLNIWLP